MSVAKVLRLDEYRERRTHRLHLAEALHRDSHKRAILAHLVEIADLSAADRVATIWLDEYGNGLIHPHVVLDLSSDRPRRTFSAESLREAWELGVPGACDCAPAPGSMAPATLAVSLGSDGTRTWFLVAESAVARASLDSACRDRIMFLAGECAAVLLHRDLDLVAGGGRSAAAVSFAGWRILEDLEGREPAEVESRRVAQRFVVGRLARMLVDEDLTLAPDRAADQARRARAELRSDLFAGDPEAAAWHRVLDALEQGRHGVLAAELVQLADAVESQGHAHGALELYRCAFEIAAALGDPRPAVDAARLAGRLLRRRAEWDEARRWFETAHEIAGLTGMPDLAARALVGLAGIKKETGNLPAAREGLRHALALAETSADRETIALVHHTLMGVEQVAGNVADGLMHGWVAVGMYDSAAARMRCLAGLAGALADYGDRAAAEDAWSVVAHASDEEYYRIYAYDALAYLAALRGDAGSFETHSAACDALGWSAGQHAAKAEILYYRGLGYRALGRLEIAEHWLRQAVSFAEEHRFTRVLFLAEEALRMLVVASPVAEATDPTAPPELREGLRAMRRELVGAATA
jgi:tetratricopeptide (TPR) repeat protein